MRFFYDSIYIGRKRGDFPTILYRPIDQYSYRPNSKKKRFERAEPRRPNSQGYWINISKYLDRIYQWDDTFRFTTIVICTYTVALIFLFHLTGSIILLYQYPTNNPIRYVKQLFEFLLNIGRTDLKSLPMRKISSILCRIKGWNISNGSDRCSIDDDDHLWNSIILIREEFS